MMDELTWKFSRFWSPCLLHAVRLYNIFKCIEGFYNENFSWCKIINMIDFSWNSKFIHVYQWSLNSWIIKSMTISFIADLFTRKKSNDKSPVVMIDILS